MYRDNLMPSEVQIIDIEGSWNCDKCLFFKEKDCECRAVKRLLFGQALREDCEDGKRPFVLKSE